VIANPCSSDIAVALLADNYALAQSLLKSWAQLFPDHFYLGLARTGRVTEDAYNNAALKLAADQHCPVVATNEVCFTAVEDYEAHEARVCINEGRTLDDKTRLHRYSKQQFLRNTKEMRALFADLPEALENSVQIAQRWNWA